ncbi:hypothetical protein ONZ45_g6447 [Pleurotus djamor]|nr:hypothetical protein ONZ45_g6447 [Pleurotus djamor]
MAPSINDLAKLTLKEILDTISSRLTLSWTLRREKKKLLPYIIQNADSDCLSMLEGVIREKEAVKGLADGERKRKRAEAQRARRVARKLDNGANRNLRKIDFLGLPTEDEVKAIYHRYYRAISKGALAMLTCGVCASEVSSHEVSKIQLSKLQGSSRLVPQEPNKAHKLYEGKLLEPAGVTQEEGTHLVNVCGSCLTELKKPNRPLPPPRSLANNLWVGPVPWELQTLTFPEQLLIALLFPRVYVFKLFPKSRGTHDSASLQRAMRGTVSSYDLNMEDITSMLDGKLMPRLPSVLASVITVTYVGIGSLSKNWLRSTFRVRRHVVAAALLWLKENNPYYSHIEIQNERLQQLPEDDVPDEIANLVRQSEDTGIILEEHNGYVPDGEDEIVDDVSDDPGTSSPSTSVGNEEEAPDVIPLQISGVIDTDLTKVSANDLMMWGLSNLWREGKEGGYAVRYGKKPVNDFGRSLDGQPNKLNFFERAFPCLYPYGVGGIEAARPVPLDFREHIQWSLLFHDRRFRRHETFAFVSFGILQRRQSLYSARVQIRDHAFESESRLLSSITVEDLNNARVEEEKNVPISNPAIQCLRRKVFASAGRVMGSDHSRYQMRSQIFSTTISKGPPSLWITINPCDLHDPIAQIFAGEDIDIDAFLATMGPSKEKRAVNIASDPYAAAKFFHFLIQVILETLFGIKATSHQVVSEIGVFGYVSAYFGTVESQNRGSLHLHLLLWLEGAPSADEMLNLLKQESFRNRVKAFITANIRAYLPGLETATSLKTIPNESSIAYSRPPNPGSPTFAEEASAMELRVVRSKQVHTCEPRRCLVPDRRGGYVCKRRAPFDCADDDIVEESGKWKCKRLYGYINGYNPSISIFVRCNNDIKLLTNGAETKSAAHYVGTYASKKQGRNFNTSAIMAQAFAYHTARTPYSEDLRQQQRKLVFRLVHAMNKEQELAAPMVVSYLMGWGDSYRSHNYTNIYWSTFVKALLRLFPDLSDSQFTQRQRQRAQLSQANAAGDEVNPNPLDAESGPELSQRPEPNEDDIDQTVSLAFDTQGKIYVKSQVTDYSMRGSTAEDLGMIDYFVDTYEEYTRSKPSTESSLASADDDAPRRPGRRPNDRIQYLHDHPKHSTVQRVVRTLGHNNLPNFIGRSFPRRDDDDTEPFYCASMLMLLKPWRDLKTDLKGESQTWREAYDEFITSATPKQLATISNIQYLHESRVAAETEAHQGAQPINVPVSANPEDEFEDESDGLDGGSENTTIRITDELIEGLEDCPAGSPEGHRHGLLAIEYAKYAGIFQDNEDKWSLGPNASSHHASGDDLVNLQKWRSQLAADMNAAQGGAERSSQDADDSVAGVLTIDNLAGGNGQVCPMEMLDETSEAAIPAVDPTELRPDQRRAYDIVAWHLDETLMGKSPPPLRMVLHGEGGTGKSKVIQTVTSYFTSRGASAMLLKSAYTGIAASLIDGKTTHVIGMISLTNKPMNDETKKKLQQFWQSKQYLIIDEVSMISKAFFAALSRNISIGKAGKETDASFGGVNVILAGDFHQFPPVGLGTNQALFHPSNPLVDSLPSQTGRKIYEEFTTVVLLKEQMRVTDPVWNDFLRHLRIGQVKEHHVTMLQQLVMSDPSCQDTSLNSPGWKDAALVTPRHAVREPWNKSALRKDCAERGEQIYVCPAEDTIRKRPPTRLERYVIAQRRTARKDSFARRRDLPKRIELAKGMKVMVTTNLATDLDITNGARGVIVDIILHPDEPPVADDPIVKLKYLPSYILVKLFRTRATQLDGLEESIIPVEPLTQSFRIKVDSNGKERQATVKRRQYPVTAAYAFTDYRSQGQTIPYVIVDISRPPGPPLSLFNVYVALSRSSGRDTIRLLRNFDKEMLVKAHDMELLREDDRLEELNELTRTWWMRMGEQEQERSGGEHQS